MAGSSWTNQIVSLIILSAGTSGFSGFFTYSPAPGAGNLTGSVSAAAGTDPFGNHYVAGSASYAGSFATAFNAGFIQFYTGSLAAGWSATASIEADPAGDLAIQAAAGRSVITTNNTLDDGSGNMTVGNNLTVSTINGSSTTGSGNNGGVTSGPSGTTNAFPAAGPNHTHAEIHQHPI